MHCIVPLRLTCIQEKCDYQGGDAVSPYGAFSSSKVNSVLQLMGTAASGLQGAEINVVLGHGLCLRENWDLRDLCENEHWLSCE